MSIGIILGFFLLYISLKKLLTKYIKSTKVNTQRLASLPKYYVLYSFLWVVVPFFFFLLFQTVMPLPLIKSKDGMVLFQSVLFLTFFLFSSFITLRAIKRSQCVRGAVEKFFKFGMFLITCFILLSIFFTLCILFFESIKFFSQVSFFDFMLGTNWTPDDIVEGSGSNFGALPLFGGTLFITFLALIIAVPLGMMVSICLSEYVGIPLRNILRPLLETMAGIPTVVYGFFAAIFVAPIFQKGALAMGFEASAQNALAAGVVLGVMLVPMLVSLCLDVLTSVPKTLRAASLALGATQSETIIRIVLPTAKSGLIGAFLLTFSRAIGETMLVVMAAGLSANLTANPFSSVTTVTVQIVSLLTGDQQFDSPQTLAAFALGFVLFFLTLGINFLAEKLNEKGQM